MYLPQTTYEVIRWLVAVVLPAIIVFFETLAKAWGWNIPVDAITTSLSAFELFLGTVFGISKLSHDKAQAEEAAKIAKK